MKKLLLLSAFFIFACSSDDSLDNNDTSLDTNNNTTSERLIESFTLHTIYIHSTQNCEPLANFSGTNIKNCYYNNDNLITSFTSQYYEFSCPDNYFLDEEKTDNYEYFDDYVVASSYDSVNQMDLNENSNFDTFNLLKSGITYGHNIIYQNGYIGTISRTNGYFEVQFTYENGNLINIYIEDENGDIDEINITYSQYENKSKLFHPFSLFNSHYLPTQNFYGKNNANLPANYVRNVYKHDGELIKNYTKHFNYSFDPDGYVISLVEVTTNPNLFSDSFVEKTYGITYTK